MTSAGNRGRHPIDLCSQDRGRVVDRAGVPTGTAPDRRVCDIAVRGGSPTLGGSR